MIKKILKYFRKKDVKEENYKADDPEIEWLESSENPWDVPVLDVRPITLALLSTSTDKQCAFNSVSYGQDDGTCFIGKKPDNKRIIETNLLYRRDSLLADGALFIPNVMEHKWAIYFHDNKAIFIRSWLRKVQVVADIEQKNENIQIKSIQGTFTDDSEQPEFTEKVFDYLLRSHALDIVYPVPLPENLELTPKDAASWCFSLFGNMAYFATPHAIKYKIPEKPLRSHSLLHISVARGNIEEVEKYLSAGLPKDLLSADGMTPMHWALAHDSNNMLEYLLSKGSEIDARSDEGATPLMNAVQDGNNEKILFLLEKGANPNAIDNKGFTALHRAAELGKDGIVRLLLERGALKDIEAQGHTPLSLAEMQGVKKIIKILKAS